MLFWNSLAVFYDPVDVGNLIFDPVDVDNLMSGSSAFSKSRFYLRKFADLPTVEAFIVGL